MGAHPVCQIAKGDEGTDITAALAPYIRSVEINDLAGGRVDSVTLELGDDASLALPRAGNVLNVSIGYRGEASARKRVRCAVDQFAHQGPPASIRLSATAVDFSSAARAPKERTHEPQTLGALLNTLCAPHGYAPVIRPPSLGALMLPLVDQAGQSDLALADELARTYGAIFKPVDGKWAILGYGVLGAPALTLRPEDVTSWRAHFIARRRYAAVTAYWHDYDAAKRTPVTAGGGEPVQVLHKTYADEATALAHAQAALAKGAREARQLQLTLPGRPDLATHTVLALAGFRAEVDDNWLVTRVSHTLDKGGYRCRVEAEGLVEGAPA